MARRLQAANVRTELLLLTGGGHTAPLQGLFAPQRAPQVLPAILRFVGAPAD
jgi:hypothetical protein